MIANESKPTTILSNGEKVSIGETWDSIQNMWNTETRNWLEVSQLLDNQPKQSSTIINTNKP